MSLKTFQSIIDHYTPRQIALGGGEPTCHPELLRLVQYAKEETPVPTRHVNYTTNEVSPPRDFDRLKNLVSGISVSVDTLRYPRMLEEGAPKQVEKTIAACVDSPIQVILKYVVNETTLSMKHISVHSHRLDDMQ